MTPAPRPLFRTITLADWPEAIRRARAQRNVVADRIRAKASALTQPNTPTGSLSPRPPVSKEP